MYIRAEKNMKIYQNWILKNAIRIAIINTNFWRLQRQNNNNIFFFYYFLSFYVIQLLYSVLNLISFELQFQNVYMRIICTYNLFEIWVWYMDTYYIVVYRQLLIIHMGNIFR